MYDADFELLMMPEKPGLRACHVIATPVLISDYMKVAGSNLGSTCICNVQPIIELFMHERSALETTAAPDILDDTMLDHAA